MAGPRTITQQQHVEIFKGKGIQPWHWRLVAGNGGIISVGGEGYLTKWNAKRAAKRNFPDVPMVVK